jgi:hypothetical protein
MSDDGPLLLLDDEELNALTAAGGGFDVFDSFGSSGGGGGGGGSGDGGGGGSDVGGGPQFATADTPMLLPDEALIAMLQAHNAGMLFSGLYSNRSLGITMAYSILHSTDKLSDILPEQNNLKMPVDGSSVFLYHADYVTSSTGPTIKFSGNREIYFLREQSNGEGLSVQHGRTLHDGNTLSRSVSPSKPFHFADPSVYCRKYQFTDSQDAGVGPCLIVSFLDPDGDWIKKPKSTKKEKVNAKRGTASSSSGGAAEEAQETFDVTAGKSRRTRGGDRDDTTSESSEISSKDTSAESLSEFELNALFVMGPESSKASRQQYLEVDPTYSRQVVDVVSDAKDSLGIICAALEQSFARARPFNFICFEGAASFSLVEVGNKTATYLHDFVMALLLTSLHSVDLSVVDWAAASATPQTLITRRNLPRLQQKFRRRRKVELIWSSRNCVHQR